MEHFFENIQGWFNFEDVYRNVVAKLPDGAHIVEIGAWRGRSTAFLAVEIINSGKRIKLDVVDSWTGEENNPDSYCGDSEFMAHGRNFFELFKKNMSPVEGLIELTPIQSFSVPASLRYQDQSLDFVFIDADHHYDAVVSDILHWRPKVKPGGFLAGHDYNEGAWPDVIRAVDELVPQRQVSLNTWWVQI